MKIENCFYSVELDEQLRLTLSDKRFGGVWNSDAPFQLRYGHCWDFPLREHAEHSVECENGIMRIRFRKLDCFARFKENQYRRPLNVPDFLFEFSEPQVMRFAIVSNQCRQNEAHIKPRATIRPQFANYPTELLTDRKDFQGRRQSLN